MLAPRSHSNLHNEHLNLNLQGIGRRTECKIGKLTPTRQGNCKENDTIYVKSGWGWGAEGSLAVLPPFPSSLQI